MKKHLMILSFCFALIMLFGSCNSATSDDAHESEKVDNIKDNIAYEAYTAYIDVAGMEGASGKIEASKKLLYLSEADIPTPTIKAISVEVLGKRLNADFSQSKVWSVFTPAYVYKTSEGDKITVDSSGKVISFTSASSSSNVIENVDQGKALIPEESLAKATEYFKKLLGDELLSQYSAELPDTSMSVVRIRFRRNNSDFGSYSITDKIIIKLDEEGNLLGYDLYNVGAYDNKNIPADFNDEKIKEIINASLIDNKSDIEVSDQRNLVILSDGRLACNTCFRLIDGEAVGEWASVLIPLE